MLRLGMRGQRIVRSELDGDLLGQAAGKTAGHIQLGELIEFGIGAAASWARSLVSSAIC